MSSWNYANPPRFEYAPTPPPPAEPTYVVPPPPPSAFSPHGPVEYTYAAPPSPLVVAASPAPSIGGPSRGSSQVRSEYIAGKREYLAPGGYNGGLSRSNSERGRERGQIVLESRRMGGHSRSRSGQLEISRTKYYVDDDGYSNYSASSYGADSRGHSRSHSRARSQSRRGHSRTPSCGSSDYDDNDDGRYALAVRGPSKQEMELNKKLAEVQKQLEAVQVNAEKKRLEDEAKRLEKLRTAEVERLVAEKILQQKKAEELKAKEEKRKLEEEKKRIEEAANKILEERAAAQKAAAAAAAAAAEKQKADIQAALAAERAKYDAAQQGKKTYTRFSKAHLCKEALEERGVQFSEEEDYFLVHRFVEKSEQQFLWNRTKEIREYYKQIQEAADRAPTVQGPNGTWVKYVQIAGQPYPIALPVTITHTPGGGQTQRVGKIKWTDIFK
ncbi:hypothetical protein FN846DRAFT_980932 [Sphaerosporella brunnea]|uniref:DUF8035 domain-containing protein n=1 Tax=Sphaerosporella brunnea TaxID=1250544 RepID=A0A5J5ECQ2_9PEZI|nr:hypothetical protein FN846DRAFT_980932 [Sphaerosporella brunnea]